MAKKRLTLLVEERDIKMLKTVASNEGISISEYLVRSGKERAPKIVKVRFIKNDN